MNIQATDYAGGALSVAGLCLALFTVLSWRLLPAEKATEKRRSFNETLLKVGVFSIPVGVGIIFEWIFLVAGFILAALGMIVFVLFLQMATDPNFRDVGLTSDPRVRQTGFRATVQITIGLFLMLAFAIVRSINNNWG
jgi:hypothetical protein